MKNMKPILMFIGLFFISQIRAQCTASFIYTINPDGSLTFTNVSTSSNATVAVNYTWTLNGANLTTSSLSQTVSAPYVGNGSYFVQLNMSELNNQCISSSFSVIPVMAPGCPLTASASAITAYTSPTASFSSLVTGTTNSSTYFWEFGDGTTSNAVNPNHLFLASGMYIYSLTVSNSTSCSASFGSPNDASSWIGICFYTPSISYTVGAAGVVTFTANDVAPTTDCIWVFEDNLLYGHTTNPTQLYFNGTHTPTLYCNLSCGQLTHTTGLTVTNNPCNSDAAFTYTALSGGAVAFSKTAPTSDPNISYMWRFGDGSYSNLANVTHTYSSAGNYLVRLHSFHSAYPMHPYGADTNLFLTYPCWKKTQINMNITGIPCLADASFSIHPGGNPHQYLVIPNSPYNVIASTWSWGDGSSTTSSSLYTFHTYSAAGSYDLCLTVTTSCGAVDSFCVNQYLAKGTSGDMLQVNIVEPALKTGITEVDLDEIEWSVFPNPNNNGILSVRLSKEAKIREIKIFDLIGKEVYLNSSPETQEVHSIDLTTLTNGIYFIQLKLPRKTVTSKFIISR